MEGFVRARNADTRAAEVTAPAGLATVFARVATTLRRWLPLADPSANVPGARRGPAMSWRMPVGSRAPRSGAFATRWRAKSAGNGDVHRELDPKDALGLDYIS